MSDLTPKQEGFVKDYLDTGNATEAAARNYNVSNRNVAKAIGSENLAKPDVRAYLESKAERAAEIVYELATMSENDVVRLNASKDILDRAGHKPVERTDITSGDKPLPILTNVSVHNSNIESTEPQEEN